MTFQAHDGDGTHGRREAHVGAAGQPVPSSPSPDSRPGGHEASHDRRPPGSNPETCPKCGKPSASPPAEVYCVDCATEGWEEDAAKWRAFRDRPKPPQRWRHLRTGIVASVIYVAPDESFLYTSESGVAWPMEMFLAHWERT